MSDERRSGKAGPESAGRTEEEALFVVPSPSARPAGSPEKGKGRGSREEDREEDRARVGAIMAAAHVALFVVDPEETLVAVNPAAERLWGGLSSGDPAVWGLFRCGALLRCVHREDHPEGCGQGPRCAACPLFSALREVLGGGEGIRDRELSLDLESDEGPERRVFTANLEPLVLPAGRHAVCALTDITDRKRSTSAFALSEARLRSLFEIARRPFESRQELLDFTLHEAIRLTGSRIGYIYLYDEDSQRFELNSWSREVMKECQVADPSTVYELDKTGIWGEAVRQRRPILMNDFQEPSPLKKGYPEGHVALERFLTVPVLDRDRIVAVVGVANKEAPYDEEDVLQLSLLMDSAFRLAAQRRAEQALKESEIRVRAIFQRLPIPTFVWQRRGEDHYLWGFNEMGREVTRGGVDGWEGRSLKELYPDRPDIVEDIERAQAEGVSFTREMDYRYRTTGEERRLKVTYGPVPPDLVLVHTEDITEQRRLEAQLVGGQRLEAIGRLAGGVAHDFNNLLSVILSYQAFVLEELREGDPAREDLKEAHRAAQRAAALTRQLLAFSRRQVLEPRPLHLNALVGDLEAMLGRLIGEDIAVRLDLVEKPWAVLADPSQLEQVLMNLAVNARDAMPQGGTLTIETRNVSLDVEYAARHVAVVPGDYVRLAVSDTGTGMDPDTRDRVFEPFFTTKPLGQGTGLGLSTVYGIVKQSGGNIWVYSEPGLGTTFKVYLPRVDAQPEEPRERGQVVLPKGDETLLVVEDDEAVRRITVRILAQAGYEVLSAGSGGEALLLCESHGGPIHLLVTDVVMPLMSGKKLADRLALLRPHMKVLFMSGYTEDAVVHHGVLEKGLHFLDKPFSAEVITRKVREVLGSVSKP